MFFLLGSIKGHTSFLKSPNGSFKQNLLRMNVQTYSGEGHWWSSVVPLFIYIKGSDQQKGCISSSPGVSCNIDI